MTAQSTVQRLDEVHSFQMAVLPDPILDTATGTLQSLSISALHHPNLSLMIQSPVRLETKKDDPAFVARMKPAESHDFRLLRGHRQFEL
jgi:hypothetical protein